MPDVPDEAVRIVAEQMLRRYDSQYKADHLTWRDFADDARADLEAAAPAMTETRNEALRAALNSLTSCATTSAGDFGAYGPDAWLYGIIAGWDCEEDHEHDSICGGTGAMEELAARHRWDDAAVERLRQHRRAFAAAAAPAEVPGGH